MNLSDVNKLLKVAYLMREMPVGEGWTTATDARNYSGVSHSTTYRYLPKLVKLGYLENKISDYRKNIVKSYRITTEGREYLKLQKELF